VGHTFGGALWGYGRHRAAPGGKSHRPEEGKTTVSVIREGRRTNLAARLGLGVTVFSLVLVLSGALRLAFWVVGRGQIGLGIFCLLVLLSPCWIVLMYWNLVRKSKNWPVVTGEVISSRLKREGLSHEGEQEELWCPHVEYRYSALGHTHTSTRIISGGKLRYSDQEKARTFAGKHQVGSNVTVFYDPRNAESSVLERRLGGRIYSLAQAVLIIFASFVLLVLLVTL